MNKSDTAKIIERFEISCKLITSFVNLVICFNEEINS